MNPAMAAHRRLLVWWLTSAGILLVILLALAGYFVVSTVGPLLAHGTGCLPSDFPVYQNTQIIEVDVRYDGVPNGDRTDCRMRMGATAPYDSVNTFYRKQLNSGDWWYSSYFEQGGGSIVQFSRRSRAVARGSMTIHDQAGGTPFEVDLVS